MKVNKYILFSILTAVLCTFSADNTAAATSQDIAIIPYSVETIQRDFPVEEGLEYAKTIAVAAVVIKDLPVYPVKETQKDISRLGLDPQGTITRDDIDTLCKSRYLSYAVLGRISKTSNGYSSQSILYSVTKGGVVAKAEVRARTLPECAARETEELFARFADAQNSDKKKESDIAIVLDSSYPMKSEWNELSQALIQLTSRLIDATPGTRLHVIPYAENFSLKSPLPVIETVPAMKSTLSSLTLKGGGTGKALSSAISFAIENTQWRSSRVIVIISNSPTSDIALDKYALNAKQRNITIHALSLGNMSSRDTDSLRRMSAMTGGSHLSVAYRSRVYDTKSNEYFLFMQEGRLFEGDSPTSNWKDGILHRHDTGSAYVEIAPYADEITIKKDARITPYTMAEYYRKSGSRSFLNSDPLESNISQCIDSLTEKWTLRTGDTSPLARVLISNGKSSLWISVSRQRDLDFFIKQKELGFVFPLGARLSLKSEETFGMAFNPLSYYTGFDWDALPSIIRTSLDDIAKNPSRFAKEGLFNPPVWFVNVRVEEIDIKKTKNDLRETR